MKRLVLCVVCGLFCFIFAGCHKQSSEQKIVPHGYMHDADLGTWDFGNIQEGKSYSHAFAFRNGTDKPLTIKDVSTSCGCTVSTVKKKKLAPGEETEIGVTFDSTGYEGEVLQFIYVRTDNLDKPVTRFIIKAFVVRS